ncbi:DEAD/DEAH box helicase domain-containing protein [Arcanobacterium wilhelmae]|uniref:DEAD/DEAH box helicase domain-containing protein n=1 Tax=Arcanobacterium wilhelmae TaxID=1803177 RepID=A0ABT9NBK0_9ACTO|nr:DEAD/DEAH box helicase [Arcanobacterium wilhelmae]MDP9801094.1 DEAD/DEAH box helicase domain-containing protein [Arcanobacterium wilhelmae]WFN90449.1 DEAD/DEAH box helicase [Arcanobacterium wilhelmae]
MATLLDVVRAHGADQITGIEEIPPRPARFGEWGEWVAPTVLEALWNVGIPRPWTHQAQAADLLHAGNHVVLATGTGSGKSLAAWVPVLSAIEEARDARSSLAHVVRCPTALYLSPTKALAADQENSLSALAASVNPRIGIATVDGDADTPTRSWARDYADIVLTNPDFVNHAMLASSERWGRLWRGLSFVVLDEFHSYRGTFGSNVALVVRRLLRLARHYGANPRVIFLSATSGDPAASARRFLGEAFGPVTAVTDDGSPTGARQIVTLQTAPLDSENAVPAGQITPSSDGELSDVKRRAANTEAGELTARLVASGASVLTFVRSRPAAERVAEVAHHTLAQSAPHLDGTVAAYRGGYLPEERRELEKQLRTGDLRALATTSALELGIDVSGLDAVIVTGWPGTHSSFQQQIGRAGRAGNSGLAVFIGRDNPLDQYVLAHPETLANTPAETNVFDPANPWILPAHLCAAAGELPLTEADAPIFSLPDTSFFSSLETEGLLVKRPAGWFWNPAMRTSPHSLVDMRGGGTTVSIIDSASGALLGTVDEGRAESTVHPGAIYLHQGVPYQVETLADDVALVHLHREDELRTYPREETSVEILHPLASTEAGPVSWNYGKVVVTNRVVGYDVRRVKDGMYLGMVPLEMPLHQFETTGCWFTATEPATREAGIGAGDLPGALHGAEHTMIGLLPLFATCDRWDLGGLSTALHGSTGQPTVIVHDAIAGGAGAALRGYEAGLDWLEATLETLRSCPCDAGCPRCVQSPKCGNNNSPLSKDGAITLLTLVTDKLRHANSATLAKRTRA